MLGKSKVIPLNLSLFRLVYLPRIQVRLPVVVLINRVRLSRFLHLHKLDTNSVIGPVMLRVPKTLSLLPSIKIQASLLISLKLMSQTNGLMHLTLEMAGNHFHGLVHFMKPIQIGFII